MRPKELVLRCYGYSDASGKWCGVCLDFNLAAEADSIADLRAKINAMIESYVEAVLDTKDAASIPLLFRRRAPLSDWLLYYLISSLTFAKRIPGKMTFNAIIPLRPAHENC